MAKHMGILEVGSALVELLRANLTPDIIQSPDAIGLCSPDDKGDIILGLHLYDIRESEEIRVNEMQNIDVRNQKYPSTYLTLSYMITAYSTADVKFRAGEDHKILGKVVQVFHDNVVLNPGTLKPVEKAGEFTLRIRMANLEVEAKQRLWNFPNNASRVSLFYRVGPVEVESDRIKGVQRVVQADWTVRENEEDERS
jgi:hypothetical protein